MKDNFKAVLFDFDYTLADSSKGIAECINYSLDKLGLEPVSEQSAFETIGLSLPNTFLKLTENKFPHYVESFSKYFVYRADEIMVNMTSLFDGVPNTIRLLKNNGLKLGIVSTKFRYRIEDILKKYNLSGLFDIIIGGEDVQNHKPDPEGLLLAIKQLGLIPEEVLYAGDSITDAETAKRAGVAFTAVLSGVTSRQAFLAYEGCTIIERISEI